MAATLPISCRSYLYKLALFFVLYRVKMFAKQVLWIYVSVFLSLTLCTTRVYSQSGEAPSSKESGEESSSKESGEESSTNENGQGLVYRFEAVLVEIFSMATNRITVFQKDLKTGNEKMIQMLAMISSKISKLPNGVVNGAIIVETTVYGRVTAFAAFVLKNAGMEKQSEMVENFGSSMKTCYNENKQNTFETILVSIPMCVGDSTTALVEMVTADTDAFQVIVFHMEQFYQGLENCNTMGCYRKHAEALATLLRSDLLNWGKTRGKILMKAATLGPKTIGCLGENTGIASVQELVGEVKDFGSCVAAESKK